MNLAGGEPTLVLGVVNNMPDAAIESTERQFRKLLVKAAGPVALQLRWFALPEIARGERAQRHIAQFYEPADALWSSRLDGLIVTGAEPHAAALTEEPYWPAITRLVEWVEDHTTSTIWSCLAAHAAVLKADSIERRALPNKLSGVYECERRAKHPLTAGATTRWPTPHSRYNDLSRAALARAGYQILGWSAEAGVDLFVRQRRCLSVYLQGHPEYDGDALHREYRRDVRRYLNGEREQYPQIPLNYFGDEMTARFEKFRRRAQRDRNAALMQEFPSIAENETQARWNNAAIRLYSNWLHLLESETRPVMPIDAQHAGAAD